MEKFTESNEGVIFLKDILPLKNMVELHWLVSSVNGLKFTPPLEICLRACGLNTLSLHSKHSKAATSQT
jgi:hypothetical protein